MFSGTHLDFDSLASLVPDFDARMGDREVTLHLTGRPVSMAEGTHTQIFSVCAGLPQYLAWLHGAHVDGQLLEALRSHASLGPALKVRPEFFTQLKSWRFVGEVSAIPEGYLWWSGPFTDEQDKPLRLNGRPLFGAPPLLQIKTNLASAKLIAKPLSHLVGELTAAATHAARMVSWAHPKPVVHLPPPNRDRAWAAAIAHGAHLAGCSATNSLESHIRLGIPLLGTCDALAVRGWADGEGGAGRSETAFFAAFARCFPRDCILPVDTYDAFGAFTGIRAAVRATAGRLEGIRFDHPVTPELMDRARGLLDALGASHAQIMVTAPSREEEVASLRNAPIDLFGLSIRPEDYPAETTTKVEYHLSEIDGRSTPRLRGGQGPLRLPGKIQLFRQGEKDLLATEVEEKPGEALLQPVWSSKTSAVLPPLEARRSLLSAQLMKAYRPPYPTQGRAMVLSKALMARIAKCADQDVTRPDPSP